MLNFLTLLKCIIKIRGSITTPNDHIEKTMLTLIVCQKYAQNNNNSQTTPRKNR